MARKGACASGASRAPVVALFEAGSARASIETGPFGRAGATAVLPWANTYEVLRFPSAGALESVIAFGAASRAPAGLGGGFLHASSNARIFLDAAGRARLLVAPYECGRRAAGTRARRLFKGKSPGTLAFLPPASSPSCRWRWERPAGPVDAVVTSWLAAGGDGFGPAIAKANATRRPLDGVDADALEVHLAALPAAATYRAEGRVRDAEDAVAAAAEFETSCAARPLHATRPHTAPPAIAGVLGAISMTGGFVATYPLSTLQTRAMLGEPLVVESCAWLYRGVGVAAVAACSRAVPKARTGLDRSAASQPRRYSSRRNIHVPAAAESPELTLSVDLPLEQSARRPLGLSTWHPRRRRDPALRGISTSQPRRRRDVVLRNIHAAKVPTAGSGSPKFRRGMFRNAPPP